MKVITKLYCPFCGEEMMADIHKPDENGEPRSWDNWICDSDESKSWICKVTKKTIVFDRDDIERLLI